GDPSVHLGEPRCEVTRSYRDSGKPLLALGVDTGSPCDEIGILNAASRSPTLRAASRISMPRIARRRASAPSRHGFTRTKSSAPKFLIDRATAPTFPSFFGSTRTTRTVGTLRSIYCKGDIPWHAGR